jgi:hypothetical protein
VTFQIHGGGHAMAIYEVSKNTTRDDIGPLLCGTADPTRMTDPTRNATSFSMSPRTSPTSILDNRAWSEPGRLMSAGGVQFLNGGTTASGTGPTGGRLVAYRFLKTGRYLVHCMNRVHFLNDWMFGFVNVVGE